MTGTSSSFARRLARLEGSTSRGALMPTSSSRHDRSRRLLDLVARHDVAPAESRLPALRVSRLRDGQVLESQTVGVEASDDAAEAAFAAAATERDTLVVLEYDMVPW